MIAEPEGCGARDHACGRTDGGAGLDCQLQPADDSAHRGSMNISYSKHTLENGLDVLIHEDRACPIVSVNIWYHVGSKNETPARLCAFLQTPHVRGVGTPRQGLLPAAAGVARC
jgi:hypothetical protein